MKLYTSLLTLGAACSTVLAAAPSPCPLVGPAYPWPTPASTNSHFLEARKELRTSIKHALKDANQTTNSIALQVFDATDPSPLFQWAYTSDDLDPKLGVRQVTQDTVFRVGSVSKIWAVYLFLVEEGFDPFAQPIANYVPELQAAVSGDAIDTLQWANVTIGELASHLAGVPRDYGILDLSSNAAGMEAMGFPVLPPNEIPPCGSPFFAGLLERHPIVPVSSTPIYSNAAFQILGYALEALTNDTFENVFQNKLLQPLNLKHTFYTTPNSSLGVIPNANGQGANFWNMDLGDEGPAGGIYSSANDMATLGRAILNNTLLDPLATRRWMKPATHTSSIAYGVGTPWEIVSFPSPRLIDLYTKAGDIGTYSTVLALSPDHGVGFVILVAGTGGHAAAAMASDLASQIIIPAVEYIAKYEARKRFAGTYSANNGVNSSITITTDDGPGLKVTNWISNSTDMFKSLASMRGTNDTTTISIRLYPTGLESSGEISFRALIPPNLGLNPIGPFTSSCITWVTVDSQVYGSVGLDEFVFALDSSSNAVSVSPRVLRIVLQKQS
ncbi:hypothetical protein N7532_000380 [Penicillium argentinense]|uniref:Beta-lactamase-related domain-containing protein n=1 Tax=Penicillium argentinense TaxID=1131581 RepID=A0A9W9KN81_9EURO|nr:uncharacterized protein N7532_000380 [Penicillium argentinense]KAJ5112335.1 hypothetical protein N7532_000380 [Penicillium argentinense]